MSRYFRYSPGRLARGIESALPLVVYGLVALCLGTTPARLKVNYCTTPPLSTTPILPSSFSAVKQAQGAHCIAAVHSTELESRSGETGISGQYLHS